MVCNCCVLGLLARLAWRLLDQLLVRLGWVVPIRLRLQVLTGVRPGLRGSRLQVLKLLRPGLKEDSRLQVVTAQLRLIRPGLMGFELQLVLTAALLLPRLVTVGVIDQRRVAAGRCRIA
jgi:hypothetical protein